MSKSVGVKLDLLIHGFPLTGLFFSTDYDNVLKIFKTKFPDKKDASAKDGPFDESFSTAVDNLKEYFDFDDTFDLGKYIDTIDFSYASFDAPLIFDTIFNFLLENDGVRTIKVPDASDVTVRFYDFKSKDDDFYKLLDNGDGFFVSNDVQNAHRRAILKWVKDNDITLKNGDNTIDMTPFYNGVGKVIDLVPDQFVLTVENPPEGVRAALLVAYTDAMNKSNKVVRLPKFLKEDLNENILKKEFWDAIPMNKTSTGGVKLAIQSVASDNQQIGYFSYKEKVLIKEHKTWKFDLKLSTGAMASQGKYKQAEKDWKACRDANYGKDKTYKKYDAKITWEQWLDSNLQEDDPFYALPDYKKSEIKDFKGTNKKFLTDVLGIKTVSGFFSFMEYASGEVIVKEDLSVQDRANLSLFYNLYSVIETEIPLYDKWRDANKNWLYPTLEDRVLLAIEEFGS